MKVKLLEDFIENKRGSVISVEGNIGRALVGAGKAEFIVLKDIAKESIVEPMFKIDEIKKRRPYRRRVKK